MFIINKKPAEAAKEKGYAKCPEDFVKLQPGQEAVAWKDGEDWQIETRTNDTDVIKAALLKAGCKVTSWN